MSLEAGLRVVKLTHTSWLCDRNYCELLKSSLSVEVCRVLLCVKRVIHLAPPPCWLTGNGNIYSHSFKIEGLSLVRNGLARASIRYMLAFHGECHKYHIW